MNIPASRKLAEQGICLTGENVITFFLDESLFSAHEDFFLTYGNIKIQQPYGAAVPSTFNCLTYFHL